MQFMNSSLDKVVKNLSDEDFKYLVEESGSENLQSLKQKGDYSQTCLSNHLFKATTCPEQPCCGPPLGFQVEVLSI